MITVHHLNNSRSQRVLWLLEEIGTPYEIKFYQRNPATMLAPPELRAVHPLGKSPVITDGGRTIAESGAIIEYLVDNYAPHLKPTEGTSERLAYTYWLHYAEGSAMPPLLLKLIFSRIYRAPVPWLVRPIGRAIANGMNARFIDPAIKLHLDYMENTLATSEWFTGAQFTAADIQMSFPLEAAAMRGGLNESRPKLMRFLERIHARPAYMASLAKGGLYELLA